MPAATTKRRKLGVTSQNCQPKGGLGAFTNVSKSTTIAKVVIEKNYALENIININTKSTKECKSNERKRKLQEDVDHDAPMTVDGRKTKSLPHKNTGNKKITPSTPERTTRIIPQSSISTPTKEATKLFDRLLLSSSTPARSILSDSSLSSPFDASTPKSLSRSSEELPEELFDLINLHASFLTALSIHYAHNGTHSPADLRMLCPDVARAWGKRKVLVEDIRRTLGVMNYSNRMKKGSELSRLSLSDYGHGKICVEIQLNQITGAISRPINENILNGQYVNELKQFWAKRRRITTKEFVTSLPLEDIKICASLTKISPMLAKGQRRLEDLKTGIALKKEEKVQKEEEKKTFPPKTTLLERLKAKELLQSTLAAPLTKEQIARRAALSRMEEVISVLSILSTSGSAGQSRVSFTLATALAKLKDSFRTPISKDEGEMCLRLLATEIAPQWVKIAKMGKVEALVVNRETRPLDGVIRSRLQNAAKI